MQRYEVSMHVARCSQGTSFPFLTPQTSYQLRYNILLKCTMGYPSQLLGVVTKPYGFEGRRRMQQALQAIENLRAVVDTLIIVSNDK